MRTGYINSRVLPEEGFRLTGGFHLSEDQVAVSRLRAFRGRTSTVRDLVEGRGVFRGPIFKRVYVEEPSLGEPYVSARDLVMADVRPTSFLSPKLGTLLDELRLHEGMILVTCSGMNLGSAIWTRADLDGLVASHDLIRLIPDKNVVPPGYLYAFLASRYGRSLIRKQIYGGNIKHVEPHHVESISVPRLPESVEAEISSTILSAARGRADAVELEKQGQAMLLRLLGLSDRSQDPVPTNHAAFEISSGELQRLDAAHFSPPCVESTAELASFDDARPLRTVARVFTPGIFKRIHVDDPAFGYPYFSGSELFRIDPQPRGHLSKKWTGIEDYRVQTDWLLVQDAGQLGGLIGRLVRTPKSVGGGVVSNHLMRIATGTRSDAAFLFALLSSPTGYRAIVRNAFGSSIPQLDPSHIGELRVPWPDAHTRRAIADSVVAAWDLEDVAAEHERAAIARLDEFLGAGD